MVETHRIALVGATGLIGTKVMEISRTGEGTRIVAIARREISLPKGARMECFVADPDKWGEVLEAVKPRALICALGTTWKKAGKDEASFRAVDQDLVLQTARAAKKAGIANLVAVSSSGADAHSKHFYPRVKGEVENELSSLGIKRLDILQPGLLKGPRENDRRLAERLGIMLSPLINPFLSGKYAGYRAIDAELVAQAALYLSLRRAAGRYTHDNTAILRAAREWRSRDSRHIENG